MKDEKSVKMEKEAAGESKMSLAAKKAWETRRKNKGMKKKEKRKKSGEVKKGKRFSRIDSQLEGILKDGDVSVEQLKKGRRKGVLMPKKKRVRVHKSSVKLTGEGADSSFIEFLNGLTGEQVLINKLCEVCWRRKWCQATIRGKMPREARIAEPIEVLKALVVEK